MSRSTNQLKSDSGEQIFADALDLPADCRNRVSVSAGTNSRLSMRNNKMHKRFHYSGDWHAEVLQTARVLHEQIAHMAKIMNKVDSLETDSCGDDDSRSDVDIESLPPETRKYCTAGLKDILVKV